MNLFTGEAGDPPPREPTVVHSQTVKGIPDSDAEELLEIELTEGVDVPSGVPLWITFTLDRTDSQATACFSACVRRDPDNNDYVAVTDSPPYLWSFNELEGFFLNMDAVAQIEID